MRTTLITVILAATFTSGCKTSHPESELAGASSSDQAEDLAQEFESALLSLKLDWNSPALGPTSLDLSDPDDQAPVATEPAKITYSQVSRTLLSVSNHLTFIIDELSNEKSEYHIQLKEKNIAIDDRLESLVLKNAKAASIYADKATILFTRANIVSKAMGKDLDALPIKLNKQVASAYLLLTFWDSQLQAIEMTIRAKEGLRSASQNVDEFFKSLNFISAPPPKK